MSRSYKKNSFDSWASSKSMKAWRTQENRRLRHNAKQLINTCEEYDELIIPVLNDYDTIWGSPQDGRKHYVEKPYINNCEMQLVRYINSAYTYWIKGYNFETNHHKNCDCYTNKNGWYWKNMRK